MVFIKNDKLQLQDDTLLFLYSLYFNDLQIITLLQTHPKFIYNFIY